MAFRGLFLVILMNTVAVWRRYGGTQSALSLALPRAIADGRRKQQLQFTAEDVKGAKGCFRNHPAPKPSSRAVAGDLV